MCVSYQISQIFPTVDRIVLSVLETNAWPENRLQTIELLPESKDNFYWDCPMSKCLGNTRGISYRQTIYDMVENNETQKQVKLQCQGYGGYNQTFHCDWYVKLEILIKYNLYE
jgi:hypothetical protein